MTLLQNRNQSILRLFWLQSEVQIFVPKFEHLLEYVCRVNSVEVLVVDLSGSNIGGPGLDLKLLDISGSDLTSEPVQHLLAPQVAQARLIVLGVAPPERGPEGEDGEEEAAVEKVGENKTKVDCCWSGSVGQVGRILLSLQLKYRK